MILSTSRCSKDSFINADGSKLIDLFDNFRLKLLNSGQHLTGELTFVGVARASTLDYACVSNECMPFIDNFKIDEQIFPDHMSLIISFVVRECFYFKCYMLPKHRIYSSFKRN